MTFEEVLNEAVALLQRQGRVAYRVLKRQFDLEDDYLEDLKEAILYAHPQVRDDGRGLLWSSDPSTAPASPALQPTPHTASLSPDAERRQLTVMFCDLVDSTPLSEQLDPEDLRAVVRAYQETAAAVIKRFEGHIAQLLGDGLLVYFGWPQAHEDDVQRAIRAGLGLLDAMGTLNTRLEQDKGLRLAMRVGVHTGLVVVGEMGGGSRQEQLALGDTPNIAARLQGLAAPDTVVISGTTARLSEGYFTCEALGAQPLKGVSHPMAVYRVLGETGARSRLDVVTTRGLTPLVGREREVEVLVERWEQVRQGQGQVVLLRGEAGIGKSRLVRVLREHLAGAAHTRLEWHSSPYYQHTAFYPVTEWLHRTLAWPHDDPPHEQWRTLAAALSPYPLVLAEAVPLFAALLSLPLPENVYPPLTLSPQQQRHQTLSALRTLLLAQTVQRPVLLILEDLHWTDPSTLELLSLLIEHAPSAALYMVLTCRPEFQPPWGERTPVTPLTLQRFTRPQSELMVARITGGQRLPAEVLAQIVEKTDGVPLFVEELTKAILESGVLQETEGRYVVAGSLSGVTIPATLQDALMARLDRLVTAKAVAQYAAVIGRQFSYALLHAVSQLDALTLQRELHRLVEAEILMVEGESLSQHGVPSPATYAFQHALIQEAAYHSLLKSTRQRYHQQIAQVLTAQFPETVEAQPELLAYHWTEAGLSAQAIGYWQRAGQRSYARSAYVEASGHLTKGLAVLTTLPDTPERAAHELEMLIALGQALGPTKGYAAPDVERLYVRARALCHQVGDPAQLFWVLWGLCVGCVVRAELQTARELAAQRLTLAQRTPDAVPLSHAHMMLGIPLFWLGEFSQARGHLEQGSAHYDAHQHHAVVRHAGGVDPGVVCHAYAAQALWMLGYPEQAMQQSRAALTLAQALAHPFSVAHALSQASVLHQLRREGRTTQECAEEVLALCTEQGFPQLVAMATILRGWGLAAQGQAEEGMAQMRHGLALNPTGTGLGRPPVLTQLAEVAWQIGQTEEGLRLLAEALAVLDTTGERWWEAELHRLRGELVRQSTARSATSAVSTPDVEPQTRDAEAETCFQQALAVARRQQAKSLELRAAISLSRLWQRQGKRPEAYELLASVYTWFTEGFDTADLQEAKALFDELR